MKFTLEQLLVSLYQNCHAHDLWRNLQKRLSPFHRQTHTHTHTFYHLNSFYWWHPPFFIHCLFNQFYDFDNFLFPCSHPDSSLLFLHCVKAVIIHWQYCCFNRNEKREENDKKKWWVCVCVSLNWKLNAYKMVADSSPCRIISHSNLTIPKLNYL